MDTDTSKKEDELFEVHELPDVDSLEDMIPQGTYDFPVAIFEDHMNKKMAGYVRLHWHEVIQFSYVIKGSVAFTVESRTYVLNEGEGIFINSQAMHMATYHEDQGSIYRCVNFSPRMLTGFGGSIINRNYVQKYISKDTFPCFPLPDNIINEVQNIYNTCHEKKYGYELIVSGHLYFLWHEMISQCFTHDMMQKPSLGSTRIKPMIEYIHANYKDHLSLGSIASAGAVSKGECCRLFSKATGMSPFGYVIKYRIEKSLLALCDTDRPVAVIGSESGFTSPSYYIKCFRRITGLTPGKYRALGHEHLPGEYLD